MVQDHERCAWHSTIISVQSCTCRPSNHHHTMVSKLAGRGISRLHATVVWIPGTPRFGCSMPHNFQLNWHFPGEYLSLKVPGHTKAHVVTQNAAQACRMPAAARGVLPEQELDALPLIVSQVLVDCTWHLQANLAIIASCSSNHA